MVFVLFGVAGKVVQDTSTIIDLCETGAYEEDCEAVLFLESGHVVSYLLDLQLLSLALLTRQQNSL